MKALKMPLNGLEQQIYIMIQIILNRECREFV